MWNIFLKAAADPSSREIICVLDALDECQERSRKALADKLFHLYGPRRSARTWKPILKFLVTSRPDFNIIRNFQDLTNARSEVRLRGEEESEQVSREIDLVIGHKVEDLGSKMDLSESDKSSLRENLSRTPHRTYLWLYLTLDFIGKKLEFTKDEIAVIAKTIPQDVDDAYTEILNKSPDRKRARRLLHIVLAATRPLTLQEVNVAMVMEERYQFYEDLAVWRPDMSEDKIKNMCGLFLSVVDSKVYLIHQTAREFLVCEEGTDAFQASFSAYWKKSFHVAQSNLLLAKVCIWYIQLRDREDKLKLRDRTIENELGRYRTYDGDTAVHRYMKEHIFISYAAKHWAEHFTQAQYLPEPALVETVAHRTLDMLSLSFKFWFSIWEVGGRVLTSDSCILDVSIASYFGHDAVLRVLLERKDKQADSRDKHGRTPLSYAAEMGNITTVLLLIERKDVQADSPDQRRRTPLSYAVGNGYKAIAKLLLERADVQADSPDYIGRTPLWYAVYGGHEAIVKLLLERKDVQAGSLDYSRQTPLWYAAYGGHEAIVQLLLEREDVQADSPDYVGRTLLWYAESRGHEATVKILLGRGDVHSEMTFKVKHGRTMRGEDRQVVDDAVQEKHI